MYYQVGFPVAHEDQVLVGVDGDVSIHRRVGGVDRRVRAASGVVAESLAAVELDAGKLKKFIDMLITIVTVIPS